MIPDAAFSPARKARLAFGLLGLLLPLFGLTRHCSLHAALGRPLQPLRSLVRFAPRAGSCYFEPNICLCLQQSCHLYGGPRSAPQPPRVLLDDANEKLARDRRGRGRSKRKPEFYSAWAKRFTGMFHQRRHLTGMIHQPQQEDEEERNSAPRPSFSRCWRRRATRALGATKARDVPPPMPRIVSPAPARARHAAPDGRAHSQAN